MALTKINLLALINNTIFKNGRKAVTGDKLNTVLKEVVDYAEASSSGGSFELLSNKSANLTSPNDTKYPTTKAVSDALALKENSSNKSTNLTSPNDTKYPTTKAVTDALALKQDADGYTRIVKSTNQDFVGTSGDDSVLQFPVVAGGIYHIRISLIMSGDNTTADNRFYFQSPLVNFKGIGTVLSFNSGGAIAGGSLRSISNFSAAVPVGVLTADINEVQSVFGEVTYFMKSSGTVYLGFGNNTSTPGAISRMWAGSSISYKKIN